MKNLLAIVFMFFYSLLVNSFVTLAQPSLKISENRRFLCLDDGKDSTFFWLGDTGWRLFTLNRDDIQYYVNIRKKQGFNVIQGPVIISYDKNDRLLSNGDGELPLSNINRLSSFNTKYLDIYDFIIDKAAESGMYVALLPFWAQGINRHSPEELMEFGKKLAMHFSKKTNLVWIVGGEAAGESDPQRVNALARGLHEGSGGKTLISVHPGIGSSSTGKFWVSDSLSGEYNYHNAEWLDFNMLQSGHNFNTPTYKLIEKDYGMLPVKPTFESEFFYENHPSWDTRFESNPLRSDDFEVRKGAYWSVFSGGFGFTYGHHAVWQFYLQGKESSNGAPTSDWKSALLSPGANQMKYLKNLVLSRPFYSRKPDQKLLLSQTLPTDAGVVRVIRDGDSKNDYASYIMAYIPGNQTITLNTSPIKSKKINVSWFFPETGNYQCIQAKVTNKGSITAQVPEPFKDAVLIVDDAGSGYPCPGY
jgi:hypothetical protein